MSTLGLSSAPDPLPTARAAAQAETTGALHRGANWLFLIAGLSVVNTVSMVSGSQWIFLGGLGVTQLAAAVAMHHGSGAQLAALFINLWAMGFFVCLGIFARKGQKWAFITGMSLYAVDAWWCCCFSPGSCCSFTALFSFVFTRAIPAAKNSMRLISATPMEVCRSLPNGGVPGQITAAGAGQSRMHAMGKRVRELLITPDAGQNSLDGCVRLGHA